MIIKNQLNQAYKQAPWRIRTQTSTLFLIAIVLAACGIWIMVSISIQAADAGMQIQVMTFEELSLTREIADLRSQSAMFTSTSGMEKRALDMGFRPATSEDLTYSVVKGYPGRQPEISAPPPGTDLPPGMLKLSYTQSLSDWLWQELVKIGKQKGSLKP